ncbi:MAG: hypothetical protein OEM21_10100, partial [Nitrosopumilus sp.]|nr:hypothetical protein [Nitrosopumilus sp.]
MKIFFISIIFLIGFLAIILPGVSAQNANLIVSVDNPQFNKTFSGPMVIEVVISNPDISKIDEDIEPPLVTIDGKDLIMVQAKNGKWYAYFADRDMAQIADSTATTPGTGLDFGTFCSNLSNLGTTHPGGELTDKLGKGVRVSNTVGIAVGSNLDGGISIGNAKGGSITATCKGDYKIGDNQNVVRNYAEINIPLKVPPGPGQIGLDPDAWPFIQLFDFSNNLDWKHNNATTIRDFIPVKFIDIQYKNAEPPQKVTLTFVKQDSKLIKLGINGTEVNIPKKGVPLILTDLQLNIDPTDKDFWTWTTGTPAGLFYQFFNETGHSDVDGTFGVVDVSNFFSDLLIDGDRKLLLNPYDDGFPTVVNLKNNAFHKIKADKYIESAKSEKNSLPEYSQPITFREIGNNTGKFTNFDDNEISNTFVAPDAENGSVAWLEYAGKWVGILIFDNTISWDKPEYLMNEKGILKIINSDKNIRSDNNDSFFVNVTSESYPRGINLKVKETGINSGIFMGSIKFVDHVTLENELLTLTGDKITANFLNLEAESKIIDDPANPECDPKTDPNECKPCDPKTDPNECKPCDPKTDPN